VIAPVVKGLYLGGLLSLPCLRNVVSIVMASVWRVGEPKPRDVQAGCG
jgi:hypothetical protein